MSITNAQRHDLHSGLQEVLGEERAETLMDHLPPVGWADVATKRDLDALEERVGLRFDKVDIRFDRIDLRFDNVDLRLDKVERELRHEIGAVGTDVQLQIADLRTSLMRQQLFLSCALIGVLGTLMAFINGIG